MPSSLPLPENNGATLLLWLPFRHLFLAVWPSPIIETQAVVPGSAIGTHASPEDGSGPTARGYLWCSELTFWWRNQKTRRTSCFREAASHGTKETALLLDAPRFPLESPQAPEQFGPKLRLKTQVKVYSFRPIMTYALRNFDPSYPCWHLSDTSVPIQWLLLLCAVLTNLRRLDRNVTSKAPGHFWAPPLCQHLLT